MKKHSKARIFLIILLVLLALCLLTVAAINLYMVIRADNQSSIENLNITAEESYPYAVVLGAKSYPDGRLSEALQARMDTAIILYQKGIAEKLLLSGGKNDVVNEPEAMKAYAIQNGVKAEDILLDEGGFSTSLSIMRLQTEFHIDRCIIVTQKFHLARSLYLADYAGIDSYGVSCENYTGYLWGAAREILARVKDFLLVTFHIL